MMFDPIFLSALTAGLLGSLHCAGMCGGIATALGMGLRENATTGKPTIAALFYQFGRVSSYIVAGMIAGSVGDILTKSHAMTSASDYLRLISAVFMIGLGLYLAGWFSFFASIEKIGLPVWKKISPITKSLLPVRHLHQAYALGFLWGWIPCGLTYSILLWSIASGSAVKGGLLMLAFGLGTLPALLPMTLGAGKIHRLVKQTAVRVIAGVMVIAAGLYIFQHTIINMNIGQNDNQATIKKNINKNEEGQHH